MSGIRAIKKVKTRKILMEAAAHLFVRKGFERTTIEAVAARAEAGVGTVYNYFKSKSELLAALVEDDVDRMEQAGAGALAAPNIQPGRIATDRALGDLLMAWLGVLARGDRRLWRAALSQALVSADGGEYYWPWEKGLGEQVAALLRRFQMGGRVHPTLPMDDAAAVVVGFANGALLRFLMQGDGALETVERDVRRQIAVLLRTW